MAKERRPGLGLLDRVVLLLAWITTCALVYLLGFYVGRGATDRRFGLEDRLVRLPVTSKPPPEGQRTPAGSEFTFYDTLAAGDRGGARTVGAPPSEAPAPPAARPPAPAPRPAEPPPRVATAAPVAPPPTPARPVVPAAAGAAPAPARVAVMPPPAAVPPPAAAAPPGEVASAPPPARGGWSVQASPTQDRAAAEALNQQLRGRGYDARIVRVLRNGETWYRVQVGRFATAQQANETMHKLRDREGVSHVFIGTE
jgi:cell division protein FtsN